MCFSAMTEAYLRHLEYLGQLDREGMEELMRLRYIRGKVSIPFAMDRSFDKPRDDWERQIKGLIGGYRDAQEKIWQAELFKQTRRLNDADRLMATPDVRPTIKAINDKRISTKKIDFLRTNLANLRRTEP